MLPGAAVSGRTDQRHTNGPHIFTQPRSTGRVWGKTVFVEAQSEPRALTKTAYLCPAAANRPVKGCVFFPDTKIEPRTRSGRPQRLYAYIAHVTMQTYARAWKALLV